MPSTLCIHVKISFDTLQCHCRPSFKCHLRFTIYLHNDKSKTTASHIELLIHIHRHDVQSTSKAAPDDTSTSSAAVAYWTGDACPFYNNFIPLICQMNGLQIYTSFLPTTMVGTQKTTSHGRSPDHVIIWYKNNWLWKKIKTMVSHVCLATWIAYIASKYIAVPKSEIALFTPGQLNSTLAYYP